MAFVVYFKKMHNNRSTEKNDDTMYHRGPNDSGEEIFQVGNGYYLGFAQRRLSIMDLSMLGHQPMYSNDRRIVITYNGEIYNFQDLRTSWVIIRSSLNVIQK